MPNQCIYVIGGSVGSGELFEGIEFYDTVGNNWHQINLDIGPRSGICTIPDGDAFYIIGGRNEENDGD